MAGNLVVINHALSYLINAIKARVKHHIVNTATDTAHNMAMGLRCCLEAVCPVFDGQADVDAIDALDISESDKELILGGNAKRLFNL